eukprot:ANDGO_08207.mRNA.1 Methylglyoxal synthase
MSTSSSLTFLASQIPAKKSIALVAHDHRKQELVNWCKKHRSQLELHTLCATGTTGGIIQNELGLPVKRLQSGPLGGDQQIGALIVEGHVDMLVFFWDPLETQPHDPDVKALLRLTSVWNVPVATNSSTADWLFSSPFIALPYDRMVPQYSRSVPADTHPSS